MALTDTACRSAKPKAKPYKMGDADGMFLLITPNGGKWWRLKYRFAGKEKLLSLGTYPDISLKEARERCDQERKKLANEIDPSKARKQRKEKIVLNQANTFEAVAKEWHEHRKELWKPRHAAYILRRLELDIFPEIGSLPIADITTPQLLEAIRKIEKREAYEIARRATQTCGQVFKYAKQTARAEHNPVPDLQGALKPYKKGHYAALKANDLPEFLATLERNNARLYLLTRCAMKLLMLTFVRTSELIEAKWSEFNLDAGEWNIPAERMKIKEQGDHLVPLSKQAVKVLREVHELTGQRDWVFPNMAHPRKCMSNATILGGLKRLGYGTHGDKGHMTGHGFRALARTILDEDLHVRPDYIEHQLAHAVRDPNGRAYNRTAHLAERKKMMQQWADYLDKVANTCKFDKAA